MSGAVVKIVFKFGCELLSSIVITKLGELEKYSDRDLPLGKFNFICLLLGKLEQGDVRDGVKPAKQHTPR